MVKENTLIIHTQVYFFVIAFNIAIAILNLFVARQIWRLGQLLARVTASLIDLESNIYIILQKNPELMGKIQLETYNLRAQKQDIEIKLEKIRKILVLVSVIYGFGQQQWQRRKPKMVKTTTAIKFYNSFR